MTELDEVAVAVAATGMSHAFGIPGSGASLRLVTELDAAGVQFHTTAGEAAAAVMAGTAGRLAGSPGACVSIKGPGYANLLAGLAACHLDTLPAVAYCEAHPRATAAGAHKLLDQRALARPVTKARAAIGGDDDDLARLLTVATSEVPGPALFELASTGQLEIDATEVIDPADGAEAIRWVQRARQPLVIVGALASRRSWRDRLAQLQLPVMTTVAAKGSIDERCPQAAGVYTGQGGPLAPENELLAACDLVVGIGLRQGELLGSPTMAVASFDEVGAPEPPSSWDVARASTATLDELWPLLADRPWGTELVAEAIGDLHAHLAAMPGLLPQHVLAALARQAGDVRVVVDTGSFSTIAEHEWRASTPDRFVGSSQGRNMGIGLPMAIGAAFASRERTVLLTGDGGLPMHVGELRTLAEARLPLLVILLSDQGYGSVRGPAMAAGLPTTHLEFPGRSWAAAAEGMGLAAAVVDEVHALDDAIAGWVADAAPTLVEVRCDCDAYVAMTEGLR